MVMCVAEGIQHLPDRPPTHARRTDRLRLRADETTKHTTGVYTYVIGTEAQRATTNASPTSPSYPCPPTRPCSCTPPVPQHAGQPAVPLLGAVSTQTSDPRRPQRHGAPYYPARPVPLTTPHTPRAPRHPRIETRTPPHHHLRWTERRKASACSTASTTTVTLSILNRVAVILVILANLLALAGLPPYRHGR